MTNTAEVRALLANTQRGTPTTIVFLGDSITAQRDVQGGSFVSRFAEYLRQRFPQHRVVETPADRVVAPKEQQIVVVQAGVGGNNSTQGLARFPRDVARHQPQLLVIMFGANDENKRANGQPAVSTAQYRQNIGEMIRLARQVESASIVLSPAMKNLDWVATSGLMDQFAVAAGEAAADEAACFVDVHHAWQRIPSIGSNYMVFLNSSINHPNHLGHGLFFSGLRSAVESRD